MLQNGRAAAVCGSTARGGEDGRCREFDISRKTGDKLFSRCKDCGLEGLTDRSRRPYRQAGRLPFQIEKFIVRLRQEHPGSGARKNREKLQRQHSRITLPAISTVRAVLDRHGVVSRGRRRPHAADSAVAAINASFLPVCV